MSPPKPITAKSRTEPIDIEPDEVVVAGGVVLGVVVPGDVLGVVGEEGVEGEAAAATLTESFMPLEQWPAMPQMK